MNIGMKTSLALSIWNYSGLIVLLAPMTLLIQMDFVCLCYFCAMFVNLIQQITEQETGTNTIGLETEF